ncbi:ABC-2 family transporter protein [Rubripirellula lacrimiformis]|uniref:ABC-2 family transporter protein n=1 Tax=Rubripirellula lacrimiformis TaxID=1930273 RepID=A0A517N6Q9_9BACT|nr:ABC transporter permease [Rubripirellula lacrimiformis]QDT02834.1 ABC-2 family transporter protein [Rubripirellula lacrimiformis]
MRPYFAVIGDSFHAALSSRVLWVAFVAIWLLLAFLSPIGCREDYTTDFRGQDFHNGTRMKAMLAQGLVDPDSQSAPIGRIAAAMPEDLRRQLKRVGEGDEVRIRLSVLADALNELLVDQSWYDAAAWKSTLRLRELRDLDETLEGDLTDSLDRRRARLRIEAAMPGVFESRSSRSMYLTYAGMDFPANLAVDKTQFQTLINQWVLPTIINWLLGFVLIFLGILVTASIIPDMLQPGSLHLLLSKPVSRSLLLISKFIGGCAFVLLCVTQLVLGLYLVAGLRLDIWNARLLWCIPVSVFLFSVFYSVSTLAGLRWRSPILAIGVTTIFGAICLVTGVIGGLFDGLVTRPDRLQHMVTAGGNLFASTRGGGLVRHDADENRWVELFESDAMNQDRVVPPVRLDDDTIVTARVRGGRFNPFGSGALDLLVLHQADEWVPEPSVRLPTATSWLYASGPDSVLAMNTGDLLMTSRNQIMKAAGKRVSNEDTGSDLPQLAAEKADSWLSKLSNMMGGQTEGFAPVLPEGMAITPPRAIAVDPQGEFLVVMVRGRLVRLDRPDSPVGNQAEGQTGRWSETAQHVLDGEASRRGVIAIEGDVLLLARAEDPILLFDAESLRPMTTVEVPESMIGVGAVGLGDGKRFAYLTGDGYCRLIRPVDGNADGESKGYEISQPMGPSEVESVAFDRRDSLLYLAHHTDQVDIYSVDDLKVQTRIRPLLSRWRWANRMVVTPLRTVIPQTGELGETIAAMVSGQSAISVSENSEDEELVRYKIARPVISCSVFIVVMLTISCYYFSTRDF